MPLISVIVPVYKTEQSINFCVESILNQSIGDIELILVEDGSPDNCAAICDDWAKKDDRVKVIHQPNGGLSAARNTGLANVSGEYILFVDSDDCVHPEICEKLLSVIKQTGADMVKCAHVEFSDYSVRFPDTSSDDTGEVTVCGPLQAFESFVFVNYSTRKPFSVMVWDALYKKELFDGVKFPEGLLYEDGFVTPILLSKSKKLAFLNECLCYHYANSQGIIRSGLSQASLKSIDDWKEIHFLIFDKFPTLRQATANRWAKRYMSMYEGLMERLDLDKDGSCKAYIENELKDKQDYFKAYASNEIYNEIKAFNKGRKVYLSYKKKQHNSNKRKETIKILKSKIGLN